MTELTAHRTLALREAIANDPDTAFLAVLHALCLKLFYRFGLDTCLEVEAKNVLFGTQVPGLGDMGYAKAIDTRHGTWAAQLPKEPASHLGAPEKRSLRPLPAGGGLEGRYRHPGPWAHQPHQPGAASAVPADRHRRESREAVPVDHRPAPRQPRCDHQGSTPDWRTGPVPP
jgi:hypothetical protein